MRREWLSVRCLIRSRGSHLISCWYIGVLCPRVLSYFDSLTVLSFQMTFHLRSDNKKRLCQRILVNIALTNDVFLIYIDNPCHHRLCGVFLDIFNLGELKCLPNTLCVFVFLHLCPLQRSKPKRPVPGSELLVSLSTPNFTKVRTPVGCPHSLPTSRGEHQKDKKDYILTAINMRKLQLFWAWWLNEYS